MGKTLDRTDLYFYKFIDTRFVNNTGEWSVVNTIFGWGVGGASSRYLYLLTYKLYLTTNVYDLCMIVPSYIQGGSNMTRTNCDFFTHK
jgi:hypothetical protein